jgi:hypothetical protein
MLFKINSLLGGVPSVVINRLTCGHKYGSLCARMYLRSKYCKRPYFARLFVFLVDSIEKDHCKVAAKRWRVEVKRGCCVRPDVYLDWFD